MQSSCFFFFLTYSISNLSDNNFICTIHGGLLFIIYIIMADSETETLAQLSKGNHADLEYAAMLLPLFGHHTLGKGSLWL